MFISRSLEKILLVYLFKRKRRIQRKVKKKKSS